MPQAFADVEEAESAGSRNTKTALRWLEADPVIFDADPDIDTIATNGDVDRTGLRVLCHIGQQLPDRVVEDDFQLDAHRLGLTVVGQSRRTRTLINTEFYYGTLNRGEWPPW